MKVTVCQLSDVASELEEQWDALAAHCRHEAPDLVVLPELGFSPWLAATDTPDQAAWDDSVAVHERWLERLPELGATVVVGSVPIVDAGRNHNAAFVWTADAGPVHAHRKYHLPDEPGFSEARWYERGPKEFVPVDTPVARLGFLLCTEMWFTEHARAYARAGVEVLASPRGVGRASLDKWIAGGRAGAVMSGAYGVSSNRGGVDARGFEWAGAGWIIEPEEGEVLALTSDDEPFVTRDVDLDVARTAKSTYPRYVPD
ncbi:MAG: carbon-nitrogen hydrolase family protein [Actinobacteria bacterium]|nr:carbon-nitrogen hydrolase family protein [Actinomycetota bacterium]